MTSQVRIGFVSEAASFAEVGGVGHVFKEAKPNESWVPPTVDLQRIKRCEIGQNRAFVVHVRSQKPVAHLLKVFGEVKGLNSARTAFKVVFENEPPRCLERGYFMVGRAFAEIRPFLPDDVWAKTPHVTSLLLRGPNSENEILEWWPALREQATVFSRGKSWIIRSGFRKRSAPERTGKRATWKLIASGHCFACGHAGHTEAVCPCHRSKCRLCGSPAHTAEVCPAPVKKLSINMAAKKIAAIRKALNLAKERHWELPPALCRLIDEASAEASKLQKATGKASRRNLSIIRPLQARLDAAAQAQASSAEGAAAAAAAAAAAPAAVVSAPEERPPEAPEAAAAAAAAAADPEGSPASPAPTQAAPEAASQPDHQASASAEPSQASSE